MVCLSPSRLTCLGRAQDLYIEAEEGAMGKVIITDPEGSDPEV